MKKNLLFLLVVGSVSHIFASDALPIVLAPLVEEDAALEELSPPSHPVASPATVIDQFSTLVLASSSEDSAVRAADADEADEDNDGDDEENTIVPAPADLEEFKA